MPSAFPVKNSAPPASSGRRWRSFRWFLFLLVLGIGSLAIPQVFQTVLRCILQVEAWRHGGSLRVDRIDGALWEPVVLTRSFLRLDSETGAATRMEVARAEVHFSWPALFRDGDEGLLKRVSLRGVTGKIRIPLDQTSAPPPGGIDLRKWLRLEAESAPKLPSSLEAQQVDLVFQSGEDYVRVESASFSASRTEAGDLGIQRITIRQPWLRRTFSNVRGKSALHDGKILLSEVELEPEIKLRSLGANAAALARGELDLDVDFAAFDGTLRVQAATRPTTRGVVFEAGCEFWKINIAKLGNFVARAEAAGGTIENGKFSFRGPPRDLARAQASLRFDAVNFQWEGRQWDSLTMGLVLIDRRLQVPQLDFRQGRNELHLSGELLLPAPDQKWWQGEFNATVDAKIENLTELSALVLPEFKYAAGAVAVEGSIRGRAQEFNGQLLVSGSKLTWRNAPIETLHAAVKLSGNEVQVARVELVNGDDYLRGRGLLKLSNPLVYWGELRVVVDDLTTYEAFLRKPVLPEPLAGGAIVDWTGEGSTAGHSGKFLARLRKVRSKGAIGQQLHPIDADLEASYSSSTMQFTRFALSDEDSNFTANVSVGGKALHLQGIKLTHKGQLQLEGDALLPLDVWQKWPDVAPMELLTPEVVSRVQLVAHRLNLAAAAELTGFRFPLVGFVDGTFNADGPVNALKLGGSLKLTDLTLPLGWSGDVIEQGNGRITFAENRLTFDEFTGRHRIGPVSVKGSIALTDLMNPSLDLQVISPSATLPLFANKAVTLEAVLDLAIQGTSATSVVSGTAVPRVITLASPLDLLRPWHQGSISLSAPFVFKVQPWAAWQFDVRGSTAAPIPLKGVNGQCSIDLHLTGTGAAPILGGKAEGNDLSADLGKLGRVTFPQLAIQFDPAKPANPLINLQLSGEHQGAAFTATATGSLDRLTRTHGGALPLTEAEVERLLREAVAPEQKVAPPAQAPAIEKADPPKPPAAAQ